MKSFTIFSLLLLVTSFEGLPQSENSSWSSSKESHKGKVSVYWFDNNPFTYVDPQDKKLKGIEIEIMLGFQSFLKERYNVDLSIEWIQVKSFQSAISKVQNRPDPGVFSFGGFSISPERKVSMKFSPSYMADIAVLVTSNDIPVVGSKADLKNYLTGANALVIPGTLMEADITNIKKEEHIDFKISNILNTDSFLEYLKHKKRIFGYINLPVYLMSLESESKNINRQNYFTVRREGHGLGLSKNGDWDDPINEYFTSPKFKQKLNAIIGNYINLDFYNFINEPNSENNISLLNKEKELKEIEIKLKALIISQNRTKQIILFAILFVAVGLVIFIGVLFRNNLKDHKTLMQQKAEIESLSNELNLANEELERIVLDRNKDIIHMNSALEEYYNITTTSLGIPSRNISDLVSRLDPNDFKGEYELYLNHLKQATENFKEVVNSIRQVK